MKHQEKVPIHRRIRVSLSKEIPTSRYYLWGEFGIFSAWMVCFWEGQNISFVEEVFGGQLPSEVEHLKIPWQKWWLEGTTVHPAFFAKWQNFLQKAKIDSSSMLELPNPWRIHCFKLLSIVAAPWINNMANNSFRGYVKPRLMGVAHHRSF